MNVSFIFWDGSRPVKMNQGFKGVMLCVNRNVSLSQVFSLSQKAINHYPHMCSKKPMNHSEKMYPNENIFLLDIFSKAGNIS